MLGERTVMQDALFYDFSLERHVPNEDVRRRIDRFVDLMAVRAHLQPLQESPWPLPRRSSFGCDSRSVGPSTRHPGCHSVARFPPELRAAQLRRRSGRWLISLLRHG
jgi:hypothetical protein